MGTALTPATANSMPGKNELSVTYLAGFIVRGRLGLAAAQMREF